MYRRSIKKCAWGDYYNQEGALEGNYITDVAGYGNIAGGAIDAVDPGNKYGVRSSGGAALSGLAKGAAAGASLGPVGAVVGGVVGAVSGLFTNKKAKEAEEEAKRLEKQAKMSAIINHSKGVLSTYPSEGIVETLTARYGMKIPKYPAGGTLPYPTDGSDVEQLSSDSAVYSGDTHANGGIKLDTNQDGQPEIEVEHNEVIKDDMVLSDRLSPTEQFKNTLKGLKINTKDNDTYASLAEKLAKKKGKFEENLKSTRIGEAGTAKLMTERYDMVLNALFEDQQMNKSINNIGNYAFGGKYPDGGKIGTSFTTKRRTGIAGQGYEQALTKGRGDLEKSGALSFYDISRADIDQFNNENTGILVDVDPGVRREALRRFSDKSLFSTTIGSIPPTSVETSKDALKYRKMYGLENTNQSGVFSGADIYMEEQPALKKAAVKSTTAPVEPYKPSTTNTFPGVYFKNGGWLGNKKGYYIGNDWMPLRKYATGDPIKEKWDYDWMNNSLTGTPIEQPDMSSISDQSNLNPQGTQVNLTNYVQPTSPNNVSIGSGPTLPKDRVPFSERFENNLGNIATGVGFLANQAQIGKLETEYKPTLSKAPNYNFTSRLPYLSNQIRSTYRTATEGIKGSSAQDNQALRANLFAKTLGTLNQATSDEFAREDAYKRDHNQTVFRNNVINAETLNRANYASMDNRNQRRGLTQQNIDALLRGVQGNVAMKQAKELDFMKNYMELAKSGDRGVSDRFLASLTPAMRRKYFGL